MNENAKCCATSPVEPLNDIAQNIIDTLDKVDSLSNVINDRICGGPVSPCPANLPAPPNLHEKLLCIRSLVSGIGSTLSSVHDRI